MSYRTQWRASRKASVSSRTTRVRSSNLSFSTRCQASCTSAFAASIRTPHTSQPDASTRTFVICHALHRGAWVFESSIVVHLSAGPSLAGRVRGCGA